MSEQNSAIIKWFSVAVIVVAVVASGVVIYLNKDNTQNNPSGQNQVDIAKVNTEGAAFLGNNNAPLVMAYWSDYQCPYCKRNEAEVMSQVVRDYVDTGKIKMMYKDFVFLGADSVTAGLVAKAVWEIAPEKFSTWHDAMYQKQDDENKGWGNKADVLTLTQSLGIDSVKVGQLMDSKTTQYQADLDADKAEAGRFGITGTPTFIIGKQLIIGAVSYDQIKAAIEKAIH